MENAVFIDYRGCIKYETIGELIHKFKLMVPRLGIPIGLYKRILLIMIESLENMMKHSEKPFNTKMDDEVAKQTLTLSKTDGKFLLITANTLKKQVIPSFKARIDYLNNLDQQGLKNIYKETITNGVFTKSGGAGLGLIEIVKISGNPIKYEFKPVNSRYSRYTQWVTIE